MRRLSSRARRDRFSQGGDDRLGDGRVVELRQAPGERVGLGIPDAEPHVQLHAVAVLRHTQSCGNDCRR